MTVASITIRLVPLTDNSILIYRTRKAYTILYSMSSVNEQKVISATINVKTPKEMVAPKTRLLKQWSKCLLFVNAYKMVG